MVLDLPILLLYKSAGSCYDNGRCGLYRSMVEHSFAKTGIEGSTLSIGFGF